MSQLTDLDEAELFRVEGGWGILREVAMHIIVDQGLHTVGEWWRSAREKEGERQKEQYKEYKEEVDRLRLKYRPHQGGFQKVGSHYWG